MTQDTPPSGDPGPEPLLDVVVIGAGPAGLACAVELQRAGRAYVVIEKECLVHSLFRFPTQMVYFTTPELLEIGDLPLVCQGPKPTRLEALKYYRRVVETLALRVRLYERVLGVTGGDGEFLVATERTGTGERRLLRARKLVVATGTFDQPNRLGVPGEGLPKVSHYYDEAHPYAGCEVAVIGGANSAAEAALELHRGGAHVTLVHRHAGLSPTLKYWVGPDIDNRIRAGAIRALFETVVTRVTASELHLRRLPTGELLRLPNDFVFALTGHQPDVGLLRGMGIEVDPESLEPRFDARTLESNVPGIYLAGVITAGREGGKVFIENGRFHGRQIAADILGRLAPHASGRRA